MEVTDPDYLVGVLIAEEVRGEPSPELLRAQINELISRLAPEPDPVIKGAIRSLLRRGGYVPSGRGKPASEYLAQAAREGRFPFVSNLVDSVNFLSLRSGLPMGILDRTVVGNNLVLRYGRPGEKYVFNSVGQEIALEGLICLYGGHEGEDQPLANPVKDSLRAKLSEGTRSVIALINGSRRIASEREIQGLLDELGELLIRYGHANGIRTEVIPGVGET